jgi:CheY-like chemotaxis protein
MSYIAAEAARLHVLLVEDEPLVNVMMSEILTDAGFEVCAVYDAREAVSHLTNDASFDVMFTDIHMPGMNGAELAKLAHELRPNMEIVYTSGGVLAPGEKVPGSTFVPKPYRPDAVCALLSRVAAKPAH